VCRSAVFALASLLGVACSVGDGTGEAKGEIEAPECGLSGAFDLRPNYFGAERFGDDLTITIQHGGDYLGKSDGLLFDLPDVPEVDRHIGEPLPVRYDPDAALSDLDGAVRASLYLNETCDEDEHLGLVGVGGSLTMLSIGNGKIGEGDRIEGEFSLDLAEPSGEGATGWLDGRFSFRFTRGRPAQRFP
jgi:hypothetical protein